MALSPEEALIESLNNRSGKSPEKVDELVKTAEIKRNELHTEMHKLTERIQELTTRKPSIPIPEQAVINQEIAELTKKLLGITHEHGLQVANIRKFREEIQRENHRNN